jgi:hypothetical protein
MTDPYADLHGFHVACRDDGCPIEWDFPADPGIGGAATWPTVGQKRRMVILSPEDALGLYGDAIGGWTVVAELWTHGDQPKETFTFHGLDDHAAKDLFVNASHTISWDETLTVIRAAYQAEPDKVGVMP